MEKGGNDDGVSHIGDGGSADDGDAEVTAITRRFDTTGDTLGAINELEQLLIERTGQIPVVSPELLAAHAARIAQAGTERAADAAPSDAAPEQPAAAETAPEPGAAIDWSIAVPEPLAPAPGFSAWIDPEQVAAAFDATAVHEFTDVSTKVFAVFSAPEPEPKPAPESESEPEPLIEPAPEAEPEPEPSPAGVEDDELEGIDDPAAAPSEEPAAAQAVPAPAPVSAPAPTSAPEPEPEPGRRRRLWPFGRR